MVVRMTSSHIQLLAQCLAYNKPLKINYMNNNFTCFCTAGRWYGICMGGSGISLISAHRSNSPLVCLPEKSLNASRHCVWVLIGQGNTPKPPRDSQGLRLLEISGWHHVTPLGAIFLNTRENGNGSKPKQALRESRQILGYHD